jgi:hypothetical protein
MTPAEWKRFYADERARLSLDDMIDRAPDVAIGRALVFPHTRLAVSGHLVAAVARAIVRSGADRVLAIGVVHGPRDVRQRGIYEDVPDEFSLDNLRAMLGAKTKVIARFPFLAGDDPSSLPGIDDLARLAEEMPIVATSDPIHHGVGYGTPDHRDANEPSTRRWAERAIVAQMRALARRRYDRFAAICAAVRSDFRDVGPTLAHLVGPFRHEIVAMDLVDYADVLGARAPTWVAAPLVRLTAA